jgi:hypothetical protein
MQGPLTTALDRRIEAVLELLRILLGCQLAPIGIPVPLG